MLNTISPDLARVRLRHLLESQSFIIEETVNEYAREPSYVVGGDVRAGRVWYEMPLGSQPLPTRAIEVDLSRRLGTAAQVSWGDDLLLVGVERPSPPVDLLTLMQQYRVPASGALTAVLGLDAMGLPVQLDMSQSGHMLLLGGAAADRQALLQAAAVSLALTHQPGQIQFLVIQNGGGGWPSDFLTPDYLLRPVVQTTDEAVHALGAVARRMAHMPVGGRRGARLVIIIDQIEPLLAAQRSRALKPLINLLAAAGLTLLISAQRTQNDFLFYAGDCWGARIVGRVADACEAETAVGWPQSGAENLPESGAFLLVRSGARSARYFQAAAVDQYDLSFLAGRWGGEQWRARVILPHHGRFPPFPPQTTPRKTRSPAVFAPRALD